MKSLAGPAGVAADLGSVRVELRRMENWAQLLSFCAVGASGYLVNLAVFGAMLTLGIEYQWAAVASFAVAVVNNYTLNRLVTFRRQRAGVAAQGARYFSVSVCGLVANLLLLTFLVWAGLGAFWAQASAIVLVTPVSFLGNKLWSFRP